VWSVGGGGCVDSGVVQRERRTGHLKKEKTGGSQTDHRNERNQGTRKGKKGQFRPGRRLVVQRSSGAAIRSAREKRLNLSDRSDKKRQKCPDPDGVTDLSGLGTLRKGRIDNFWVPGGSKG